MNPAFLTDEDRDALQTARSGAATDEGDEPDSPDSGGKDPAEKATDQAAGQKDTDDDVASLQKRLIDTDKERTRKSQESQFLKTRLTELDPYIKLGIEVAKNPKALALVQKVLSGQDLSPAETAAASKAMGDAAAAGVKAGLTPEQFLERVNQTVDSAVQRKLDLHTATSRKAQKLEARAAKELPHFDSLQEHPGFLGMVDAFHTAIANGTEVVPEGEDEHFHALKMAHDVMIASNPAYIKAVKALGVEEGKKSVAKKLAAAGPGGGASRGDAKVDESKISQAEKDRLGMIRAWVRGGGKRLPSAR